MIVGHNVENRHSMSRLPSLVLQCSKRGQLDRAARQRGGKLGLFRGEMLMKWIEIFVGQSQPPAHNFRRDSLAGSSGAMRYQAKPDRPGQRLVGSVRGEKKSTRG